MSTELTRSPRAGYDLVDSRSLKLMFQLDHFGQGLMTWLLGQLAGDGFADLTAKHLSFLGALDCGPNHASELARRMGVTRQAIHKSVRELGDLGWLDTVQHPDLGNQKVIEFTEEGERLMSRARFHFAQLDQQLETRFGVDFLDQVLGFLSEPPK